MFVLQILTKEQELYANYYYGGVIISFGSKR